MRGISFAEAIRILKGKLTLKNMKKFVMGNPQTFPCPSSYSRSFRLEQRLMGRSWHVRRFIDLLSCSWRISAWKTDMLPCHIFLPKIDSFVLQCFSCGAGNDFSMVHSILRSVSWLTKCKSLQNCLKFNDSSSNMASIHCFLWRLGEIGDASWRPCADTSLVSSLSTPSREVWLFLCSLSLSLSGFSNRWGRSTAPPPPR